MIARVTVCLTLVVAFAGSVLAQRYDPRLAFRSISTPHFTIHFHQQEEAVARRVAVLAEEARADAIRVFSRVPSARTHVIVSGQDDVPNGWATSFPINVIEIRTTWPRPSSSLGNTDDWLRLVLTHEYTHIVHLDRSRGVMAATRRVFGRAPFTMPNLFLPTWQVEGLATWREGSRGGGRVESGSARSSISAALSAGAFPSIDRVSGGAVSWPAGDGPYVYGGAFTDYLAREYGEARVAAWVDRTAGWPPFTGFLAFRTVFPVSRASAWRALASTRATVPAFAPAARRVTTDGYVPGAPRWDPAAPGRLVYTPRTPHGFPELVSFDVTSGARDRLAPRYLGEGVSVGRERIVFDALEFDANVALASDLYALDRASGHVRRLTVGARTGDPDLSPDGRRVAAVVTGADRRSLVILELTAEGVGAPRVIVSEPGHYFSGPRWSPDGLRLVAERQRAGANAEVVVVDAETGSIATLLRQPTERAANPAWTPDGRFVIVSLASGTSPFHLAAVEYQTRRVFDIPTPGLGARAADVSPDGQQLAFVSPTSDGEDLFVMPLDEAAWVPRPVRALGDPRPRSSEPGAFADEVSEPTPYRPTQVLVPRYWLPIGAVDDGVWQIGAETSGVDPLGRHGWSAASWWRSDTRQLDWSAGYAYSRWRPTLFASASLERRVFSDAEQVTTSATVGVSVPFRRVRQTHQLVGSIVAEQTDLRLTTGQSATIDRHAVRAAWAWSSARAFGYSVSAEEGGRVGLVTEHVLPAFGAFARADAAVLDARWYQRLGGRHAVVATRVAMAASRGHEVVRRRFGAACQSGATGLLDIGVDAVALVRGVDSDCTRGTRAGVVNIDYRFPVWRVERGVGEWPGFLRWAHGAAFLDLGDTWNAGERARLRTSVGAELSFDVVLGHALPLTLSTGLAWVREPGADVGRRPSPYVRLGRAF